ncbi:putative 2-methylthioadenine synthetase [Paracholeplasma brassicae]|uniref:Putative 2-methylthioadenine synthetase n=1 Tax=Acholeplasma brassicae TaxID=61635 RepID=U4KM90_9MOLU|nr:SAVED domain-containing protein [Paracholeplasma brassicae]CCV65126.1 putative 2-methylthioadenine synthetase [Paracholeplasma brassicae]
MKICIIFAELVLNIFSFIDLVDKYKSRFVVRYSSKNKNIIYINSNKKPVDEQKIFEKIQNNKIVLTNINLHSDPYKHLNKMKKIQLTLIKRRYNSPIYYTGFSSVPFSILDGHTIGDTEKIRFIEYNRNRNDYYLIEYESNQCSRLVVEYPSTKNTSEAALIISLSYKIVIDSVSSRIGIIDKYYINDNYSGIDYVFSYELLDDLYTKVKKTLNDIKEKGYKKIHLFSASRQSQSFVIGQAINKYDVLVYAYEMIIDKYTWKLNIQNGEISE